MNAPHYQPCPTCGRQCRRLKNRAVPSYRCPVHKMEFKFPPVPSGLPRRRSYKEIQEWQPSVRKTARRYNDKYNRKEVIKIE